MSLTRSEASPGDPAALGLDELHVLLDVISAWRRTNNPELRRSNLDPWAGYDTNADDPKSGPRGWLLLLGSAEAKLTAQLVRES